MKKRLLITSIVMMLVVAVALSTATYAWFTSNTRVEASSISLTAATSTGAAFGISWTGANDYGTALENVTAPVANSFNPLVPATYYVDAVTEGDNQHARTTTGVRFATATIRQEGGAEKYNGDVKWWDTAEEATPSGEGGEHAVGYDTAAKPYIWNNGTQNSFFIKNLSTSNAQNHLYVFADVTGVGSELVRIAIFDSGNLVGILGYSFTYTKITSEEYDGTATYYVPITGGYKVQAIADASDYAAKVATTAGLYTRSAATVVTPVYHGTIAANANVLTSSSNSSKVLDLGAFAALEAREITVYVWLDGKYLNDDTQGRAADIALNFDVTNPYAA